MLDSNLLAFFLADSKDATKHHCTFYQTRSGSEPEPAYSLRYLDPDQQSSRNCYAAALFDPYIQDVLFGEVLLQPKWSLPTLSQEEIRRNGSVPPPPEPLMPTEFTIQLYNPDQQVHITQRSGQLLGNTRWEFSMPQDTFRTPSSSILDKSQNDPGVAVTTPRINFVWKRANNFSKELTCFVTGKSTDLQGKKKSKEPDIAIALFKGLREITVYEPNLYRVDMEDPKGLEVTLLLSAAVIKDVFFGNLKHTFNVSGPARKGSGPQASTSPTNDTPKAAALPALPQKPHANSLSGQAQPPPQPALNRVGTSPAMPVTNPRTQWEIDAETARLKAQTEAELREQKRQEEIRRKERDRAASEETKRLKKMVEQEEKDRRAEQKRVEKETERLKKLYGQQGSSSSMSPSAPPSLPPQQQHPPPQFNHPVASPSDYAASMSNALAFSPGFGVGQAKPLPIPPQSHSTPVFQQPFSPPPPSNHYPYPSFQPPPLAPSGSYPLPFLQQPNPPVADHSYATRMTWLQPGGLNPQPLAPRRRSLNLGTAAMDEVPNSLHKKTSGVW